MAQGDGDIDIRIKSTNDPKGLEDAKKDVQDLKKGVKSLGAAYREAGGGLNGLAAGFKRASELYKEGGKGIGGVLNLIAGGGAKAAAAIGVLTSGLLAAKKAIQEFAEEERSVAKITASLARTQQLTRDNVFAIQRMAGELQELTAIGDGEWLEAINRGLQFGLKVEDLKRYTDAVKNLSGIIGGDIKVASDLLARAMVGNFTMLARYGIFIDSAGTQTERFSKLLEELAVRGSGQLEAAGQTLTGQWERVKHATGDALQVFGQMIARTQILQYALQATAAALSFVAQVFGSPIEPMKGFENAAKATTERLGDVTEATKQFSEAQQALTDRSIATSTALRSQLDILKEIQRREDEITDQKMATELSRVDALETMGVYTPEQASMARLTTRNRFAEEKAIREADAKNEAISRMEAAFEEKQQAMQQINANLQKEEENAQKFEQVQKKRSLLVQMLDAEVRRHELKIEEVKEQTDQSFGKYFGPGGDREMGRPFGANAQGGSFFGGGETWANDKYMASLVEAVGRAQTERAIALKRFDAVNKVVAPANMNDARKAAEQAKEPLFRESSTLIKEIDQLKAEKQHASEMQRAKRDQFAWTVVGQMAKSGSPLSVTPSTQEQNVASVIPGARNAVNQFNAANQELLQLVTQLIQSGHATQGQIALLFQQVRLLEQRQKNQRGLR